MATETKVTMRQHELIDIIKMYRVALRAIYLAKSAPAERLREIARSAYFHGEPARIPRLKFTKEERAILIRLNKQGFIVDADIFDSPAYNRAKKKIAYQVEKYGSANRGQY